MPQLSCVCCVPACLRLQPSLSPNGCAIQQSDAGICSGALDTEVEEGDTVTFISTLHGG